MDTKSGKRNILVSVGFKLVTLLLALVVKTALVDICGNGVNGLNALYLGIIGMLSVAELGVGSAISFSMYKPIVEGDEGRVAALYRLFQRLYLLIGGVIFLGGLAVMPFLPQLARDHGELSVDLYLTFLLVLISVAATYLFSAKTSLINAYKNNHISTAITQGGVVVQYLLQLAALYVTRSFVCYLLCRILAVVVQWIATEAVVRRKHRGILTAGGKLDGQTRRTVRRNIGALFLHKVGYALVNTVDSVIISAFVGVVSLGAYSNYTMILTSMTGVITLIFTSLTSVIGHLCAGEDRAAARRSCEELHCLNFAIGAVFFLGYYAVIDPLIAMLFGGELILPGSVSLVITLNGFVKFMRRSTLTFKDAAGAFYGDRWKPLAEGIVNLVLSIVLVRRIGVAGVLLATIVTNLGISHVVEPYVLYKTAFGASPRRHWLRNYAMIAAFALALLGLDCCIGSVSLDLAGLLRSGCISLAFSGTLSAAALWLRRL